MRHSDFAATANRMRNRALSGDFRGESTHAEQDYIKRCGQRVGETTLLFTRDVGNHTSGWLADPACDRCWHLSISCSDSFERDAWLRAFFGEHVDKLWAQAPVSALGEEQRVSHWRLFCDGAWNPHTADAVEHALRADGMRRACESEVRLVDATHAA